MPLLPLSVEVARSRECRQPLEAETDPGRQPVRKWIPESHSHIEQKSVNTLDELGSRVFSGLQIRGQAGPLRLKKFFSLFFYCCSSTVVSIFHPPLPPYPSHPHLPPSILPPFGFVHVSFIHVPENPCFYFIFLYFLLRIFF